MSTLLNGISFLDQQYGAYRPRLHRLVKQIMRPVLRHNQVVFFQNKEDRKDLIEREMVSSDATRLVNGSGVDLDRFSYSPITASKPVFLFVGRYLYSKGLAEYADAALQVKKVFPRAEFRVLGKPYQLPDAIPQSTLEKWFKSEILKNSGFDKDVRPHLRDCVALVLPTTYPEGVPRVVLEAMACGRPVIATDWRGCNSSIQHGYNGLLVEPGDAAGLKDAMEKMVRFWDAGIADLMGKRGRELAERFFNADRVAEHMAAELKL